MAEGSWLDGLFAGVSYIRSLGVQQVFQKALNFSSAFLVSNNAATGALDISLQPSLECPIAESAAGDVTVGADPDNGIAGSFRVPNGDGSAYAFEVDNAANEIDCRHGIVASGIEVRTGTLGITSEVSAGSVGTPATGFILYVNSADHKLYAKGSSGTVTPLASP